jgi:hypothetical protein
LFGGLLVILNKRVDQSQKEDKKYSNNDLLQNLRFFEYVSHNSSLPQSLGTRTIIGNCAGRKGGLSVQLRRQMVLALKKGQLQHLGADSSLQLDAIVAQLNVTNAYRTLP